MQQRYIFSHTGLRGIAAVLVVIYHMQFGAPVKLAWETATPFFRVGYLWVDLFFILSGFVISYAARTDERAPYRWEQVKTFWVVRFARIYPLHLASLMLLLAATLAETGVLALAGKPGPLAAALSDRSMLDFTQQLLLLNAWGLIGPMGWNIPSWSISAEAAAYLAFPLLAAALVRFRRATLAGIALVAVVFYGRVALTTGVLDIDQGLAIARCFAGFGLGMALYAARARIDAANTVTLGLVQAIGVAIVLGTMLLGGNDVLVLPGFVLLIGATWPDRGWLASLLKSRVLLWLGEISYSVYLGHFWVLSLWYFVMPRLLKPVGLAPWEERSVMLGGGMVLVLGVATVTFALIEPPARQSIVAAYARRRQSGPVAAAAAR